MAILNIILGVVLAGIVGALLVGLIVMARGGDTAKKYSNIMMRWRVGLQLLAVALMGLLFFLNRG